ncbi:hypothetical protein ACFSHO_11705 [Acinetobacter vivianii]
MQAYSRAPFHWKSLKAVKKTTILQSLKNGKELLVTGHPVFHETTNSLIAVITSVRDITALLRAQNAQRELEDIKNTQESTLIPSHLQICLNT